MYSIHLGCAAKNLYLRILTIDGLMVAAEQRVSLTVDLMVRIRRAAWTGGERLKKGLPQTLEVLPRIQRLAGLVELDSHDQGVIDAKGHHRVGRHPYGGAANL